MESNITVFLKAWRVNKVFIRRRRIKLEIEKELLNKIHHCSYQKLLKKFLIIL